MSQIQLKHPETVYWLIGLGYKLDGVGFDSVSGEALATDPFFGLQLFRRHAPYFGTGASVLFAQEDNAIEIAIDGRYFFPLPLIEPYVGLQLSHMTRSNGGTSMALKPGVQIHIAPPVTLDAYGLVRFDIFDYLDNGDTKGDQLRMALGFSASYKF